MPGSISCADFAAIPYMMRWYARPEGHRQQLRLAPELDKWNKAGDPGMVRLRAFVEDTEQLLAPARD